MRCERVKRREGESRNAEQYFALFKELEPHLGLSLTLRGTSKSRIVNLKSNFSDFRNYLPKFYQKTLLIILILRA